QREVRRVQKRVLPALEEMAGAVTTNGEPASQPESAAEVPLPLLARWLGVGHILHQERERITAEQRDQQTQLHELKDRFRRAGKAAEVVHRSLKSVLTGYGMSLQRLERALQQQELETIPTVGERFDPERMEVIEVVMDSDKP